MMGTMIVGSTLFLDSSDHLEHHGVKGMRWGIRRYQDESGHLTAKGRKKLEKKVAKLNRKKKMQEAFAEEERYSRPAISGAAAILGAISGGMIMTATAANPVGIIAGATIASAISGGSVYGISSVGEHAQRKRAKKYDRKIKAYEDALHDEEDLKRVMRR